MAPRGRGQTTSKIDYGLERHAKVELLVSRVDIIFLLDFRKNLRGSTCFQVCLDHMQWDSCC